MQWLCVHLPHLSIDVLRRTDPAARCLATLESQGSQRWIHDRDEEAGELGVQPGMNLSTAYALAPQLRAFPRDRSGERRTLDLVALQAWHLSDRVAIDAPDCVLVEIGRSHRLLAARQPADFFDLPDHRPCFARAPTPRAAALLARAGRYRSIGDLRPIDGIELRHWCLDSKTLDALTGIGVTRLGQLRALPRDGIQRRFGSDLLAALDRLTGRLGEPLPWFEPPERFDGALELMEETERSEALLFGASRLIRDLATFLEARDLATQELELRFQHAHGECTALTVGLLEPDRSAERMIELLRERMSHLTLPAPVRRIYLGTPALVVFSAVNGDLFDRVGPHGDQAWARLLERLRARLGKGSIRELRRVAEHAPEYAWESRPLTDPGPGEPCPLPSAARPLWLLAEPSPVSGGALALKSGPERIETGWWDDRDIARDYYVAEDRDGCRLWVYRDCRGGRNWYIHGLFS